MFLPPGVEKQEKIELALQFADGVNIVIDVYVEKTAVPALVQPIAQSVIYGVERGDTRDGGEPVDEWWRGKVIMEGGEGFVEFSKIVVFRLFFADARIMCFHVFQRREALQDRMGKCRRQKVVHYEVFEWQGIVELCFERIDVVFVE